VLEYTGMTGQQLLESKQTDKNFEWEKKVIAFKQWLKTQKNSQGVNYKEHEKSLLTIPVSFEFFFQAF
jgi:hypothetical protein